MVKNIIIGSENRIREVLQTYEMIEIGPYADAKLFVVYEDKIPIGLTSNVVEIEVIKEVIKEVEKIVEIDNPKLLDKIADLGTKLKECQSVANGLAKENKALKGQNSKLKKAIDAME